MGQQRETDGSSVWLRGDWTRSSRCSSGTCIEVQYSLAEVLIRDSKQNHLGHEQPVLSLSHDAFERLKDSICHKRGATEHSVEPVLIDSHPGGDTVFVSSRTGTRLYYTSEEVEAFRLGILDGEFDLLSSIA